ncbi:MAG: hypothetical protein WC967_08005 [Balneolaceae bacterium]
MSSSNTTSKLSAFFSSPKGKAIVKWLQRILFVAITAWMGYELTKIGWLKVWNSLPTNWFFYLIFLLTYFQLPLFEVWIYRVTWAFDAIKSIPTFIIKRVYNKDVLGYSGELYFFVWAKKYLSLPDREILLTIKDNNVISSVASTIVSIGLLSIFIFSGKVPIQDWINYDQLVYWILGIVGVVVLSALAYRFRDYVIHMTASNAASIFGIQIFRLLLVQAFNLLMFYVVMPETPMYVWFTYLSLEIILSRVPFLPNKDFIFVSLSISLAGTLAVSEIEIAGLMLARSALGKILNFVFFGVFSFFKPKEIEELQPDKASTEAS